MTGRRVALLAGAAVAFAGLAGVFVVSAGGLTVGPAQQDGERQALAGAAPTAAQHKTAAPRTRRPRDVSYVFPVAHCKASYARTHHDYPAADVFADRGCAFVSPVAGHVDEVTRTDRWKSAASPGETRGGRSVSLIGVDGVRYYGSHLESVAPGIRPGMAVKRGQLLGRIGESGDAQGTGTHLHFGISWPTRPERWWVRRGAVWPQRYLDAWRAGRDRSPAPAVAAAKARADDSRCHTYC